MTTSSSPAEWQKAKDQVISWMDHELRCVTAQRISQSLDMSRKQGSLMLEEIAKERSKSQITYCRQFKEGNATVFRLQSSTKSSEAKGDDSTTVFALASLEATEMITTAHERDMVQWREMVENNNFALSSDGDTIAPADELDAIQAVEKTTENSTLDDGDDKPKPAAPTVQKPFAGKPAKAVTAADFFAKHKKKTEPAKTSKSTSNTSSAATKKTTTETKSTSKTTEKTQNQKSRAPQQKVGNADDFVGDEEESDDEDIPVVKRKPKRVTPAPKEPTPPPSPPSPQKPQVYGAMDAFTERKEEKPRDQDPPPTERRRKRRKKLVEKTTMVNGYLRTEVQAIWEDVPTDEEEEERKQQQLIAKKKSQINKKNPQQMKQKSLVGFFKKK